MIPGSFTPTEESAILPTREEQPSHVVGVGRLVVASSIAAGILLVVIDYFRAQRVEAFILDFIDWLEVHPGLGVLAVILVYIIATLLFVPASILTIGVGFAFRSAYDNLAAGLFLAILSVFLGAILGSCCAFFLGRYLFREPALSFISQYPVLKALDRALDGNGFQIMLLLRLSPLIPYNALDYLSGVTSIPFWSYALALIGVLPGIVMFCYVGALASNMTDASSETQGGVQIVVLSLGAAFAVSGVAVATYYSKLELNQILSQQESVIETQEIGLAISQYQQA